MPSGMTKTTICNMALDLIRASPLVNVETDDFAEARYLNRNFDHTARVILRSYPWNFAKEFRALSADVAAPPFKWTKSYTLPAGWLRVLSISRYGERYGEPVSYEVASGKLYTNEGAPLYLTLVMDRTSNPGVWDDLFVEMVRCTLALGLANKFPAKTKFIELASQFLNSARLKAEEIDAYEGTPEPVESYDILRVRSAEDYPYLRRS